MIHFLFLENSILETFSIFLCSLAEVLKITGISRTNFKTLVFMKRPWVGFFLILACLLSPLAVFGSYTKVNGKWSPEEYVPTITVQEHYDLGYQLLYKNQWDEALVHFMVILYHFEDSPFFPDALFYSAICYFHKSEFDLSNKQFSKYLLLSGKLKHFEKVFDYKFQIAENFRQGRKKHLFGLKQLPKWSPAKGEAMKIYDEIVAALPGKEIATNAFYSKAELLRVKRNFRESIETFQTITRRFPRHSLAADSFLRISEVYLEQSRIESQNPDLIALAQVNLQRFRKSFPSDERIEIAKKNALAMKEVYSKSLYDTGRFYERKKKPHASAIYYRDAMQKYPDTESAMKSRERLKGLGLDDKQAIAKA